MLDSLFGNKEKIVLEKDGEKFTVSRSAVKKMQNTNITAAKEYANKNNLSVEQRRQLYHDVNEQVAQALKVFETAQLVLSHKDVKNVPGRKIRRYANAFMYKEKPYLAMFVAKEGGQLDGIYLYDLQAEQKAPANGQGQNPAGISSGEIATSQQADFENNAAAGNSSGASTPSQQRPFISVAEMENFVKQKIAKYNNDFQTFNQQSVRGQVDISDNARQAIIKIFQGQSDPSTVLHELAHVYLSMLNNAAKVSVDPEFHQLMRDLNDWLARTLRFSFYSNGCSVVDSVFFLIVKQAATNMFTCSALKSSKKCVF